MPTRSEYDANKTAGDYEMNKTTTTKSTSRWFVAENRPGLANTWQVLAIKKSEAAKYAANLNITTGQRYQPRIGSGESWGVVDYGRLDAPGYIGVLAVCDPDSVEERLWKQT